MSDSEELARKERRRQLIERLNEKEKLIGPKSPTPRGQMSEEELAAEDELSWGTGAYLPDASRANMTGWAVCVPSEDLEPTAYK